jgi:hypothetical protein
MLSQISELRIDVTPEYNLSIGERIGSENGNHRDHQRTIKNLSYFKIEQDVRWHMAGNHLPHV